MGPPGPKGDKGDPGVSGYQVVLVDWTLQGGWTAEATFEALCPVGKRATGGGYMVRSLDGWALYQSRPTNVGTTLAGRGWQIRVRDTSPDGLEPNGQVYAICATV